MKFISLRNSTLVLFASTAIVVFTGAALAQNLDVAFGVNAITAPPASEADSNHAAHNAESVFMRTPLRRIQN